MYNSLKKAVKSIFPKKILFKHESAFRFFLYQLYKGENFYCNVCNAELRKFIQYDDDKLCPRCGSLSRTRRLWDLVKTDFLKEGSRILDFSPSRSIYRAFKKNPSIIYTSSDLSGDFLSEVYYDITNIESQDDIFDLIICYHILEHIEDDYQAIKELYRIMKKNAVCIIQTPWKQGEIYEDYLIRSKEDRLKHFGQKDHVRIYSAIGLKQRLTDCEFSVEIREYQEEAENKFGHKTKESVLICRK